MDVDRARGLAERIHCGQLDASGAPTIDHMRGVVMAVPERARRRLAS